MGWTKIGLFAGGVLAGGIVKLVTETPFARKLAVDSVAKALEINDGVQKITQDIMDEADDVRAEAARQRKIDLAVAERMAALEEGIREEVVAEVDGKPKRASRSKAKK